MLELSLVECIFRLIPEGFLMILSIYIISKADIKKNSYLKSSILLCVLAFVIRQLPISYGVHTILCMISTMFISTYIGNIDIVKSIKGTILSYILLFLCEGINIGFLKIFLKEEFDSVLSDVTLKIMFATPSLFIFAFAIFIVLKVSKNKKVLHE